MKPLLEIINTDNEPNPLQTNDWAANAPSMVVKKQTDMTNQQFKIEEMEQALRSINFYVGGLTDKAIEYYYNKMVNEGQI